MSYIQRVPKKDDCTEIILTISFNKFLIPCNRKLVSCFAKSLNNPLKTIFKAKDLI